ncbi:response regulator transcription factor [Streptomyces sp. BE308]|uniref:response regulator transcription factor n=1 Tax=Streptomyces sp. BE308 TaxID=3002529 RepID=UPI002E76D65F|nr:response regulator transcription factor [Streptomyces sp. BE308]MEE1796939.1 response regulator transcription factor [Streptomyces sp. BE308]
MPPVRIIVAGEHPLLREALAGLLHAQKDLAVLGLTSDAQETERVALRLRPHVVVLEPLQTPGAAVRTVRALRRTVPAASVLAAPPYGAVDRAALRAAGAHACLPHDAGRDALVAAVRALAPHTAERALAPGSEEDSALGREPAPLSPRELQVVRCAAAAMTNQQIASSLGITTGTVKRHLHAAFRKLDAVSRLDAVAKALASGAITAPVPTGLPDWADAHPDTRPAETQPTETHPADAHPTAHPDTDPGWESRAA